MVENTNPAIDPNDVKGKFPYHDTLNPRIWDTKIDDIFLDVRVALLRAAWEFRKFLALQPLEIIDVILTGSNAAFNYTEFSDLDIHIIVDYDTTTCPALAEEFFSTKKALWNRLHDINVRGYAVEMYVEDIGNPVTAVGIYSLLEGRWVKKPEKTKPRFDDNAVLAKMESLADEIEFLLGDGTEKEAIDAFFDRLRRMRKSALEKGGEFSVENLAFKGLRNLGFFDRLSQARLDAHDRSMSLESLHSRP